MQLFNIIYNLGLMFISFKINKRTAYTHQEDEIIINHIIENNLFGKINEAKNVESNVE